MLSIEEETMPADLSDSGCSPFLSHPASTGATATAAAAVAADFMNERLSVIMYMVPELNN